MVSPHQFQAQYLHHSGTREKELDDKQDSEEDCQQVVTVNKPLLLRRVSYTQENGAGICQL